MGKLIPMSEVKLYGSIKKLYQDVGTFQLAMRLTYFAKMADFKPITIRAIANVLLSRADAAFAHSHCKKIINEVNLKEREQDAQLEIKP